MSTAEIDGSAQAPQIGRIALLRADAEFAEAVPSDQRADAERVVVVEAHRLPPGPWRPEFLTGADGGSAIALVLDGLVAMELALVGTATAYLWGPGDLLQPWEPLSSVLRVAPEWTVGEGGATIAVLDGTFRRAERQWPGLTAVVRRRLMEQTGGLALRVAIASLSRVEHRVLALFWHLAERWGRVQPEGVLVPMALTHDYIGRLVGAKRPTISLALGELTGTGAIEKLDGAGWRLAHGSTSLLEEAGTRPDSARPPCWI